MTAQGYVLTYDFRTWRPRKQDRTERELRGFKAKNQYTISLGHSATSHRIKINGMPTQGYILTYNFQPATALRRISQAREREREHVRERARRESVAK